jgi:hypothetical protein
MKAPTFFSFFEVSRDPTDRLAEGILHCRIEVKIVVLVGQWSSSGCRQVPAIRIDERRTRTPPGALLNVIMLAALIGRLSE